MWIDQRGSEILAVPECLRLLAVAAKEDHVGRLVVTNGQSPVVVPLNFTFHDGGVLVRIGPGRLSELVPDSLVAFEVDRVETDRGMAWSVLVRGLASTLVPDTPHGGTMPEPWVPEPGHTVLFIRPDVVTGRRFHLVTGEPGVKAGASGIGHDSWTTVAGADHVDHVEVSHLDRPVEMGVNQIQSRSGAEVPEQSGFDVLGSQRLGEQGVVQQINLTD